MALKQQMIKEIRESYNKEKYRIIFQVTKVSS